LAHGSFKNFEIQRHTSIKTSKFSGTFQSKLRNSAPHFNQNFEIQRHTSSTLQSNFEIQRHTSIKLQNSAPYFNQSF